jgi:hypothetical protein
MEQDKNPACLVRRFLNEPWRNGRASSTAGNASSKIWGSVALCGLQSKAMLKQVRNN